MLPLRADDIVAINLLKRGREARKLRREGKTMAAWHFQILKTESGSGQWCGGGKRWNWWGNQCPNYEGPINTSSYFLIKTRVSSRKITKSDCHSGSIPLEAVWKINVWGTRLEAGNPFMIDWILGPNSSFYLGSIMHPCLSWSVQYTFWPWTLFGQWMLVDLEWVEIWNMLVWLSYHTCAPTFYHKNTPLHSSGSQQLPEGWQTNEIDLSPTCS